MNFSFYIFGTPNNNYDQFNSDNNIELFTEFAQNQQGGVKLIIYRRDQLIYYTYLRHGLLSKARNEGAYLGVSMVFNNVCFFDVKGIFEIFDQLYFSMASEQEIITKDKTGKFAFTVDKFIKKQESIDGCKAFMQKNIDNKFNQIDRDYTVLDTSFNQTNLTVKSLLFSDGNSYIMDTVHKFRHVVITSQNIVPVPNNAKRGKWVLALLVIAITIISIVILLRNGNNQTSVVVKNYEVNVHEGSTYQYWGEMIDNIPTGNGKAKYNDGSIYEGYFEKGLRHGKGKMIFPDGYTYIGDYVNNKAEGQGEMRYPSGNRYVGGWKSDLKNGAGINFATNGKELSRGVWENDLKIK